MNRPLVSIQILTWNRHEEVARAIDSALQQSYKNIEIVIIDNASSDGTVDFIRDTYPQVRIIASYKNLGCPSGRNLGFANCYGDLIYCLDDDGWLHSDAISLSVERMQDAPDLGVLMSQIHEWENDSVFQVRPPGDSFAYRTSFSGGCTMIRKTVLNDIGLYEDDYLRQDEEGAFAIRCIDAGWKIALDPASIMYHKPSTIGRIPSSTFYLSVRNSMRTAMRYWPFPYHILRSAKMFIHILSSPKYIKYLPIYMIDVMVESLFRRKLRKPVKRETFFVVKKKS